MQNIDELLKAMLRDAEKKMNKDNEERIEKEIIPKIREELREEYEEEIDALTEELELAQQKLEMFGARKCTNLQRMACISEQRRITILYLLSQGWITDKNIMKSDFWNGTPIKRKPKGESFVRP